MNVRVFCVSAAAVVLVGLATLSGCIKELYPPFLGGGGRVLTGITAGNVFGGDPFTENLVVGRTFTDGVSVATATFAPSDLTRQPLGIDFNRDGKVDPVVGYGGDVGVVQILLSTATGDFISLTLDSQRDIKKLADAAAADIDNDGKLDIIVGADAAIWYLHHPSDHDTTELREWTINSIAGSETELSTEDIQAIIAQSVGLAVNLADYNVVVEQIYRNVEIADMDQNGANDIIASQSFLIDLRPRPETDAVPIQIVDGSIQIFGNPGDDTVGIGWSLTSIGVNERETGLDRDGAMGLIIYDIDGDGDLDIISAASEDNNVQVAWFENPGGGLLDNLVWTQWRIGSLRNALNIDVADVTGDGRPDVVATGGEQKQVLIFEQPATGARRSYDWDTYPAVTFDSFEPRDVKIIDIDGDGQNDLIVGATGGAVRYFTRPTEPRDEWNVFIVTTFDPPGTVGVIGYGDLDGDGDLDLVTVVDGDDENGSRISWIRNDLDNSAVVSP
ncbi:MAG: VCBS repeat-containing protein [Planctomycetes bacterium]|nr:VCBS repeat-containing protein [Planctomycetota bacterium]